MSKIVDTVEDRIQNAILITFDNIVAPKIELAIGSINSSSGPDATSVAANWECREHVVNNASFESASVNNNVRNGNDETRKNVPSEVSELSVPETHFDRQVQTQHNCQVLPSAALICHLFGVYLFQWAFKTQFQSVVVLLRDLPFWFSQFSKECHINRIGKFRQWNVLTRCSSHSTTLIYLSLPLSFFRGLELYSITPASLQILTFPSICVMRLVIDKQLLITFKQQLFNSNR